ncbi:hypothetical protein SYNPS1DRAFT_31408 [Syncephalis pseudoplumigaleata]|uniref:Uncharacterized protein n=1 Tax=Syncephalis pseudoplumigaleata TaxID=1712513 RepID=A0A4P9YSQ9_9FUNG|nr:hypothetical protein SYNPS1DRAFT_31408 [Syncephalis pseudoplumigaleata]|eukprot:RKP22917.1 hypothetical protein SYNPS1DRAFT_31408 [Syncephalis pseudoplumigaleata]
MLLTSSSMGKAIACCLLFASAFHYVHGTLYPAQPARNDPNLGAVTIGDTQWAIDRVSSADGFYALEMDAVLKEKASAMAVICQNEGGTFAPYRIAESWMVSPFEHARCKQRGTAVFVDFEFVISPDLHEIEPRQGQSLRSFIDFRNKQMVKLLDSLLTASKAGSTKDSYNNLFIGLNKRRRLDSSARSSPRTAKRLRSGKLYH